MTRHPFDPFSLVSGLLFAALGAVFMLDQHDVVHVDIRWIPAVVLLALGAAGILTNLGTSSDRAHDHGHGSHLAPEPSAVARDVEDEAPVG